MTYYYNNNIIIIIQRDNGNSLKVFTTRPDTIYGVTFLAISPEHSLLSDIVSSLLLIN